MTPVFAKEADIWIVETTITRRVIAGAGPRGFRTVDLETLIAHTPFLPPAFELIPRLLNLLDDPEANCEQIAEIIRVDAGLTADVLQMSNSASCGGTDRTHSLSDSIGRVGVRRIFQVVMKIVTASALGKEGTFAGQRVDLWRHSLAAAVGAQFLARELSNEDPDLIFTAALLHDIGKVVLYQAWGKDYLKMLEHYAKHGGIGHAGEREAFKTDHAEVAGRLLRAWKFPDSMVAPIAAHHAPMEAPERHQAAAALLYTGNIFAYRIGLGNGYPSYSIDPDPETLTIVGLTPEGLEKYDEQILEGFRAEHERMM